MSEATVHEAGAPTGDEQKYLRCGHLLVVASEPDEFWPEGARVAWTATHAYPVTPGRLLADVEHECVSA